MITMRTHHLRTVFLVGIATLTLIGCNGPTEPVYLTADETNADYNTAAAALDLPTGVAFATPNYAAVAEDGNEIFYEAGSGRTDAQYFWYCAWATEATTAADLRTALSNMKRVESTPLWGALDYHGHVQFENQLALAKTGDVSQVVDFVDLNCPGDGE